MTLLVDLANLGEMAVADLLRKTTALFVVRALFPFDDNIRLLISVARGDPRIWVVGVVRAADFRFSDRYRPPANRRARIFALAPRSCRASRRVPTVWPIAYLRICPFIEPVIGSNGARVKATRARASL